MIAIITGSALAYWTGHFKFPVALLALITTGILQILSNLANDYGDAVKVPTPKHASGRCAYAERCYHRRSDEKGADSDRHLACLSGWP